MINPIQVITEFISSVTSITRVCNRPRLIYQYSNMAPRLLGQTSIFGVVLFVSKSLLELRDKTNFIDPKASEPR